VQDREKKEVGGTQRKIIGELKIRRVAYTEKGWQNTRPESEVSIKKETVEDRLARRGLSKLLRLRREQKSWEEGPHALVLRGDWCRKGVGRVLKKAGRVPEDQNHNPKIVLESKTEKSKEGTLKRYETTPVPSRVLEPELSPARLHTGPGGNHCLKEEKIGV